MEKGGSGEVPLLGSIISISYPHPGKPWEACFSQIPAPLELLILLLLVRWHAASMAARRCASGWLGRRCALVRVGEKSQVPEVTLVPSARVGQQSCRRSSAVGLTEVKANLMKAIYDAPNVVEYNLK